MSVYWVRQHPGRSSSAFGKRSPDGRGSGCWGAAKRLGIPRVGFFHPGFWLPDHGNRDLLRSGDIESNPGPLRGSCSECGGDFTQWSRPLSCVENCGRQTHRKVRCSGLRSLDAQRLGDWRCGICTGPVGGGCWGQPQLPLWWAQRERAGEQGASWQQETPRDPNQSPAARHWGRRAGTWGQPCGPC